MIRDPALLRGSAQRVSADLTTLLGQGWSCSVDDQFVLTVIGPERSESSLPELEVAGFFEPDDSWPESDQLGALQEDADDIVAAETLELLRVLGVSGPVCTLHGESLSSCSSVWICPVGHDGPFIGELGKP